MLRIVCSLLLWALTAASEQSPTKVIIDTDIGLDIDDQWSLAWILSRPQDFEVRLIVTSTGNAVQRATTVAKFLTRVGRDDIPIAIGRNDTSCIYCQKWLGPLYYPAGYEYANWASDFNLTSYQGGVHTDGISAMASQVSRGATTIIAIAPTPNLGALSHEYPKEASTCSLFFSGGSVCRGYHNSSLTSAEYNIEENISASVSVFNTLAFRAIYLMPLDVTQFAQVTGTHYRALKVAAASGNTLVATLLEAYGAWAKKFGPELRQRRDGKPFPEHNSTVIYDVMPVAMALQLRGVASFVEVKMLQICVDILGYTKVSKSCGRSIYTALKLHGPAQNNSYLQQTIVDDLTSWQHQIV